MQLIAVAAAIVCLAVAAWAVWAVCQDLNTGLKALVNWFFSRY